MKPPIENLKWPDEVRRVYEHDLQEMWDPTLAPHIWNQYHQTLERYFSIARGLGKSPLDILDVGCAQGTLALLLAEQGHRVIASDLRQPFLDYASSRYEQGTIRFVCGNAMETDFKASFDLIFSNQILEHLVQPVEFVSHLADYLRPGGTLVLRYPQFRVFSQLSPFVQSVGGIQCNMRRASSRRWRWSLFCVLTRGVDRGRTTGGLRNLSVTPFESPLICGHLMLRYLHRWLPARFLNSLDALLLAIPGLRTRLSFQLLFSAQK